MVEEQKLYFWNLYEKTKKFKAFVFQKITGYRSGKYDLPIKIFLVYVNSVHIILHNISMAYFG